MHIQYMKYYGWNIFKKFIAAERGRSEPKVLINIAFVSQNYCHQSGGDCGKNYIQTNLKNKEITIVSLSKT